MRARLELLRRLCAEVGRPYEAVEKTITTGLAAGEDAASFAGRCRALAGIEHVVVIRRGRPWDADAIATVAAAASVEVG